MRKSLIVVGCLLFAYVAISFLATVAILAIPIVAHGTLLDHGLPLILLLSDRLAVLALIGGVVCMFLASALDDS